MVKGHAFYAIWDEKNNRWSTDEFDAARLIDDELEAKRLELADTFQDNLNVRYMRSFSSGSWNDFKNYLSKMPDSAKVLDNKIIFENTETKQTDYASKSLSYSCQKGDYSSWDKLIRTLYSPDERQKIEWAIGSIVEGDSKTIQKFLAFYGEPGSGKSTILNIIQMLFDGYYVVFDAKSLTSSNNQFSTEAFRSNPLVAIQHDGDLSRIEDNSKLNSIVSHEYMLINEKYKPSYTSKFNCFLFLASNKPVKISDSKSGVIRRLIDVTPTGRKLPYDEYNILMNRIEFELGAIAYHCLEVYRSLGKHYYDSYRPIGMMYQTDIFFNFVSDHLDEFKSEDGISLTRAYALYKQYCDEALIQFKMPQYKFRDELVDYFTNFERSATINGKNVKNYYSGFKSDKFKQVRKKEEERIISLNLDYTTSIFDKDAKNYPAQYANEDDKPVKRWIDVRTKLSDLDTTKVHYVKLPPNHIVIDFDLKDENGNKSAELNLEAASKWPPTYAEFSKGGAGVHLHYIYDFDPKGLSRIYDEGIEIKVFTGNSSLRRRLTKCNNLPIAHISTGLPKKEVKNVINMKTVEDEKMLRNIIKKALRKEVHPDTTSNVDFIYSMLDKYYSSGVVYDITDMRPAILSFAAQSTNQADHCLKQVNKMHFKSETRNDNIDFHTDDDPLVFFDVEVYPNLFVVCWKYEGSDKECVKMINPSPKDIEYLFRFKLIGFNNRQYDNHILYARYLGYTNEQLYQLSRRIIDKDKKARAEDRNGFFSEAYNLSYTDVYDFASAGNKMSLKKWEIELDIHHQEMSIPWDKPVPEKLWDDVADYCSNDVKATEIVFHHLHGDWTARKVLAKLAGMTVNDTTNSLTTRIIFGHEKHPKLVYTNFATGISSDGTYSDYNYFPTYEFKDGHNIYRGEDVGKGGYVWSKPGMYANVKTFDVAGMHPSSIIALNYFGEYTPRFKDMVDTRTDIKHKDLDTARNRMNGQLAEFLTDVGEAKDLSKGLKTANNSCYGLSSASFDNPMRHPDNANNIVALRGALFMVNLRDEIIAKGYEPIHIKTDSIKVVNPDAYISEFIMDYGKQYGYTFEIEHSFEKICLVNNAVYIAKCAQDDPDPDMRGKWTATGDQFARPYLFKTLFSHEPIVFKDLCETKSVKTKMYLDMNEYLPCCEQDEVMLEKLVKKGITEGPEIEKLKKHIQDGHDYYFVGRVGSFCPIKSGCGGGLLVRSNDRTGKYDAVTGAKGYRWLEAEGVLALGKESDVDLSYHRALVDEALEDLQVYADQCGKDLSWFLDETQDDHPQDEILPWCAPKDCETCEGYDVCHDYMHKQENES